MRPSLAKLKAEQRIPTDYNLKAGPILFTLGASFQTEFVDNVNLVSSSGDKESDIILTPQLTIGVDWKVTKLNSLQFRTSLGYTKYLNRPELDTQNLLISPDSELTFDLFIGDFKINFHDQFSYQDDPVDEGALSGVSKFGVFTNTIGLSVLWDLNDVILRAGYDHTNFITNGATSVSGAIIEDTSALDRMTDQVSLAAFLNISSVLSAGLEATASATRYEVSSRYDGDRVTAGPFLSWQFTNFTKFYISAGFQGFYPKGGERDSSDTGPIDPILIFEDGSQGTAGTTLALSDTPEDSTGFYATLNIAHRLNQYYADQLSLGRDTQIGLLAQNTETTFLRYSSQWQLTPKIALGMLLSFEDITENGLNIPNYRRTTAGLNTGYTITRHLSAGISYQFIKKDSSESTLDYQQNRVGLSFTYRF